MRLRDKVILITGSTTGIGEAIARRVLAEGACAVIHGRDAEGGQSIVDEHVDHAAFVVADLADVAAPAQVVQAAIDAFGRLDAVVNNAAAIVRSDIHSTDAALFDQVMAVNVRAPLLIIKAALPYLSAAHGCVLNIGSINAYCGESNLLAYSVSKGALMTLSRNLADALCYDQVRINHFNVGWVLTPNEYKAKIADGLPEDWPEQLDPVFAPSGAIIQPADIAAAAVYWLSDESRPVSGSVVELEQYPIIGRNPTKRGA
jgi:NAD(P)-dependent dehydrogenase (short-subunit alcohol dehydrogenase family)